MERESIPILLVEDNPADVEIIQRSLKKSGILNHIHIARDGQEALDFLRRGSPRPEVLILDIHLPKINGMEVLREAKRVAPEAVVIILTGHASLKTAIQSLRREGAFDYIQKSKDDLRELVEAVRLALEKRAMPLQNRMSGWSRSGEIDRIIDMIKVQREFGLSEREVDVVKCLCRGDAIKEIAERLFISELTVKGHTKKIYQKMGVHNRATLIPKILAKAFLHTKTETSPFQEPA